MWRLDILGEINLKVLNRHKFVLVAIAYFSKLVNVSFYARVIKEVMVQFMNRKIIYRYCTLEKIITNNVMNFNNHLVKGVSKKFQVHHHNSSSYSPKINRVMELTDINMKKILSKMGHTYKDWHETLSFSLQTYCTSIRTSTGVTSYSLVYDMEATLSIDVKIPSL